MKMEIEIDEKTLNDLVVENLARQMTSKYSTYESRNASNGVRDACDKATQRYIYSRKDEIIEKVVERATREIVRKGLPKLLERGASE